MLRGTNKEKRPLNEMEQRTSLFMRTPFFGGELRARAASGPVISS
jgi:hypothetical protein